MSAAEDEQVGVVLAGGGLEDGVEVGPVEGRHDAALGDVLGRELGAVDGDDFETVEGAEGVAANK